MLRTRVCQWLVVGVVALVFGGGLVAADEAFERAWAQAKGKIEAKKSLLVKLASKGSTAAAKRLVAVVLSKDEPAVIAEAAVAELAGMARTPGDGWLVQQVEKGKDWQTRAVVVRAFGRRRTEFAASVLRGALTDKTWQVQSAALDGLVHQRSLATIEALVAFSSKLDVRDNQGLRLSAQTDDVLFRLSGHRLQGAKQWEAWLDGLDDGWAPPAQEPELVEHEGVSAARRPQLFDSVESATRRAVFVVDTSASMKIKTGAETNELHPAGLSRFEIMVDELQRVVEQLPRKSSFNIIGFSDDVQWWQTKLHKASTAKKRSATKFIKSLRPDGATNSLGALEAAFADSQVDTIYFLSDGYPTAGKTMDFDRILSEVRRWNLTRSLRIHTIAFVAGDGKPLQIVEDKATAKRFMQRLAQENGGRYKVVE